MYYATACAIQFVNVFDNHGPLYKSECVNVLIMQYY